jgi:Ca2+-binding EF-hand superfamily protein
MLSQYSQEELGLLQAAFTEALRLQRSVSDVIRRPQLDGVMKDLSAQLPKEDLDVLFKWMDRDGNGSIDFQEFATVILLPLFGTDLERDARSSDPAAALEDSVTSLFNILDVDKDGLVTLQEFQVVLTRVFPLWNPDSLVPLFREIDKQESGTIDLDEFLEYAVRLSQA